MTINTIDASADPRPDAKLEAATERESLTKTWPGIGVPPPTPEVDLESRIEGRRQQLVAKLAELKEDTRLEAIEASDKLKAKLSELAHIIKEGVVDGWTTLGDAVTHKLDHWLIESADQAPAQNGPS
jgi:hypothetical protein